MTDGRKGDIKCSSQLSAHLEGKVSSDVRRILLDAYVMTVNIDGGDQTEHDFLIDAYAFIGLPPRWFERTREQTHPLLLEVVDRSVDLGGATRKLKTVYAFSTYQNPKVVEKVKAASRPVASAVRRWWAAGFPIDAEVTANGG